MDEPAGPGAAAAAGGASLADGRAGVRDGLAVAQLQLSRGHHDVVLGHAVQHLDLGVAALADVDLGAHRLAVHDAIDELLVALRHERLLGQHQRILRRAGDEPHAGEHAGAQRRVRIAHHRANHHRAAGGVDQRVDGDHLALERLAGQRVELHLQGLPDLDLPQVDLGHAEVDLERIDRFEVDEVGAFLDVVADRNRAQADDSRERRADVHLGELRLRHRERCLGDLEVVVRLVLGLRRDEVALGEVDRAVVLALGQRDVGLRLLHLGQRHRRIELDQGRALGHALALREPDRADASRHFRPQRDRFVRAQAAHRGDRLRQRDRRHLDRLDGDAARRRALAAGAPLAAAGDAPPAAGPPFDAGMPGRCVPSQNDPASAASTTTAANPRNTALFIRIDIVC